MPIISTLLVLASVVSGETDSVRLVPVEDTFALGDNAGATFGLAGAIHVAGANAVNGGDAPRSESDGWMKFDARRALTQFDILFGVGNWTVQSIALHADEVRGPNASSYHFARGVGRFEVVWVTDDDWSAGEGRPLEPGTATGNQIGFEFGRSLLNGELDQSLGIFTNLDEDGFVALDLRVGPGIVDDLMPGDFITLYLIAVDATTGYTFHSVNRLFEDERPFLEVTAEGIPLPVAEDDPPSPDEDTEEMDAEHDEPAELEEDEEIVDDGEQPDDRGERDGSGDMAGGEGAGDISVDDDPVPSDPVPPSADTRLCGAGLLGMWPLLLSGISILKASRREP